MMATACRLARCRFQMVLIRMPRAPSKIGFICESCERSASVRQVRRWLAECRRRRGKSWTVYVDYTDTEVDVSVTATIALTIVGVAWPRIRKLTNRTTVGGVDAETVRALTDERSSVEGRVVYYIRHREQEALRERGARPCRMCDALFMPVDEKPWTLEGHCSKLCAHRDDHRDSSLQQETPTFHEASTALGRRTVEVICPSGHPFEVPAAFSGCLRRCPACGAKTLVP